MYSEDIQIAGLLHDALEDTLIGEDNIRNSFGEDILQIVIANSKSKDLPKDEILEDIVKKCVDFGEEALIVKMADVYDNFLFYVNENIISEIERCKSISNLIIKLKSSNYNDNIFKILDEILEY
ncbi:MAG: hypothetical protein QM490_02660 [Candidatus Gracilibacteria bacterium]